MNTAEAGWRGRLAERLRVWASKLDGRWSLALRIDTTPPLSLAQQREVIHVMFEAGYDGAMDTARAEAFELALRQVAPALYADAPATR